MCRRCKARTRFIRDIAPPKQLGCATMALHGVLTVVTLGLWLPIALLFFVLAYMTDTLSPLGVRYRCERCGKAR